MKLQNPFNPNVTVPSSLFAGRTTQIIEIVNKLAGLRNKSSKSFFIYGERGIGKTALAKLILYLAKAKDKDFQNLNLLTSYYSVSSKQGIADVLQASMNKLTDNMDKSLLDDITSRVGDILKNGKFTLGLAGYEYKDKEQSKEKEIIAIKDQVVSILSHIIKGLQQEDEKKDGVLIVIDEIHNLQNLEKLAFLLRNIITTLDVEDLGKVSFLLIGYEEDLEKFFSEDSSSRRTFDLYPLGVMPEGEAIAILEKGFKSANVKWNSAGLKKNISVAGGYPFSIQMIGQKLIDNDKDENINEDDWDSAIYDSAYELKEKTFSDMYSYIPKPITQKDKILATLSKASKPLTRKEIEEQTQIKNVNQYILDLKNNVRAVKENSNNELSLHSQLFGTSIRIDQIIRRMVAVRSKPVQPEAAKPN